MLVRFRKNFFVNLQKFVKMVNVQHFQLTFTGFYQLLLYLRPLNWDFTS